MARGTEEQRNPLRRQGRQDGVSTRSNGPRARGRWFWLVGAAVILTTAAFGLLFVAASGALAPSTFEGNDGT
jgi:hypothetical protein